MSENSFSFPFGILNSGGRWIMSHKAATLLIVLFLCVFIIWITRQAAREKPVAIAPFVTGSVESEDGTIIGFRRYGRGPGIVLLHGGMMASQDFSELASVLSDRFTVYVPDRRGRGMSGRYGDGYDIRKEVEDIRALLHGTGAREIFALSVGAIVALKAALEVPEISQLAVYEPPLPLKGQRSTWNWVARYDREIAAGNFGAALLTVAGGTGDPSPLTKIPRFIAERFLNIAIGAQARELKPHEVPLQELIPTMHYDAGAVASMEGKILEFRNIRCPVLLLGGSESPENLRAPLDILLEIIPDAKLTRFKDADHLSSTDGGKPRLVAAELVQFFSQTE